MRAITRVGILASILCLLPSLSFSQNYSMHDYRTFGMIFSKPEQSQVEDLTARLLKHERDNSYWGGNRQEDVIRNKVKKYFAIVKGVYPGKPGEDDNSTHHAVKVTNEHLTKWCSEFSGAHNRNTAKAQAARRFEKQDEIEQLKAEGAESIKREKIEASRQESARRMAEKNAWQQRVDQQQAREDQQRKQESKGRECKARCHALHGDGVNFYACYNLCVKHEDPPAERPNRPWSLSR